MPNRKSFTDIQESFLPPTSQMFMKDRLLIKEQKPTRHLKNYLFSSYTLNDMNIFMHFENSYFDICILNEI